MRHPCRANRSAAFFYKKTLLATHVAPASGRVDMLVINVYNINRNIRLYTLPYGLRKLLV